NTALGYWITVPPGMVTGPRDQGSGHVEHSSQQTLELKIGRYCGDSLHEDIDLRNYTQQASRYTLELEIDGDFADSEEVDGPRAQHGVLTREWRQVNDAEWEWRWDYRAEHAYHHQEESGVARIHRGLVIRITNAGSPPELRDGRILFHVEQSPHQRWHACIQMIPYVEDEPIEGHYPCYAFTGTHTEHDRRRDLYLEESTVFASRESATMTPVVLSAIEQAKRDLASLRLYDLDHGEREWLPAAGLPLYVSLFGRDTLTTSWEAALSSDQMMRGTLKELPRWQGTKINDWRDEQPGKMLHEAHTSPLSRLCFNPRSRYYGAVTTSVFYPVVLAELWHWTGDADLVRSLLPAARAGLEWARQYGDLNGDGFYDFQTRSLQGTKNQGWKDSSDAIVYEDGSQVETPIATCEEQAYAYAAKLMLSEVLWWLDDRDDARVLYREAEELKKRFNEAFWMPDLDYFAMGLDSDHRQIRSIGSDAGHCLAAGIVDQALVLPTASRLIARDLYSGWGIRTLSADHPAFDPYSYHRGSVWPVEHGTFAVAFLRYGLHRHAQLVAKAMFDTAALFDYHRLPEVLAGHPRDAEHPFPAIYPQTNWPQAWSASAIFTLVQSLLGIYPYAPLHMLLLDPHLPEWLPELTVENLHVGQAVAKIRFFRKPDGESDYEVLDVRGKLHIVRQPSPWSVTSTWAERGRDILSSLVRRAA
ncbi:MAG TPA: glycogen debranching N-terminal domain-containing protein, partial [Terriglobales bacterium]|nr:glycogen debranching N-terminal domain-containing protein [Terriglobales bacterium]